MQTAFELRLDTAAPLNAGLRAGTSELAAASPDESAAVLAGESPAASAGESPGGPAAVLEVFADQPFRIRFEIEGSTARPSDTDTPDTAAGLTLEVRRNGGPWEPVLARDFPYPDEISTPRVSVVATRAWSNGAPTSDLIAGSEAPFVAGSGVNLDSATVAFAHPDGPFHSEWEWPLVVRRYADGAVTNDEGDVFEFRMVDGAGRGIGPTAPTTRSAPNSPAAPTGPHASHAAVTLRVPERLLGGTFVETPGVLGPWQRPDGALYFPMEPAETFNVLMMVRSPDGGATWSEIDGAHRPETVDLEGFATAWHEGVIYMLHQISEATYLHAFDTSEGLGAWTIRDELVSEHTEPPTQVAALVAHPDGRLTALFGDSLSLITRTRASQGTGTRTGTGTGPVSGTGIVAGPAPAPGSASWSEERRFDTQPGWIDSGVMATRAPDGRIHVAYTSSLPADAADDSPATAAAREVWYRAIEPTGELGGPRRLATGVGLAEEDIGAVAPLVHLDDSGATAVFYRLADGSLHERTVLRDGTITEPVRVTERAVVQNASDSDQVGVDAVTWQGEVLLAFIDEATRDLWLVRRDQAGAWGTAVPLVEDINAQWVRGQVVLDVDGQPVYSLVYDAGSDGGSGMNRNTLVPLGS